MSMRFHSACTKLYYIHFPEGLSPQHAAPKRCALDRSSIDRILERIEAVGEGLDRQIALS